jgi:SAM-dependent methyltransferase
MLRRLGTEDPLQDNPVLRLRMNESISLGDCVYGCKMVLTRRQSPRGFSTKPPSGAVGGLVSEACELRLLLRSHDEWIAFRKAHPDAVDQAIIDRCARCVAENGFEFLGEQVDPGHFTFDPGNYREGFVFQGINSRQRAMLLEMLGDAERLGKANPAIYAPEALSGLAQLLTARFPGFVGSEYMPDPKIRARHPDVIHQDLASLTFSEGQFDYVLVNDVFEHVPDLNAVLAELFRVLKDGGVLLSTFPFAFARTDPVVKAQLVDGRIEHLAPPEYHGDPVNPKGALVFQVPGWGIIEHCRKVGFEDAAMVFLSSQRHGVLASQVTGIMILRAEK